MKARLARVDVAVRRQILGDEIDAEVGDVLGLDLLGLVGAELEARKNRHGLGALHERVAHDHGFAGRCHGLAGTMCRRVRVVSPPPFGSASMTSNCPSGGMSPSAGTSIRSPCKGNTANSTSRMSSSTRVSEKICPSIV